MDFASLDLDWVRRLHAMLGAAQRAVLILAGLLGLAVLIIVGNTVRLAVLSRREEIEITKLVGGTDSFIRRPFLYAGWLAGTLGGIVAFLLVGGAFSSCPVRHENWRRSTGPASRSRVSVRWPLSPPSAGRPSAGWGSRLAVGRHLRAIEPK